jgi:hypothetical protein
VKHSWIWAVAIAVGLTVPRIASACATCGLGGSDPGAHAYNASAIFLLTGPYFTFGAIAGILYLAYRRAMRRERISGISPADQRP